MITNAIRLLKLPVPVQRRVAAGVLSAGHARALLGIKLGDDTTDAQTQLADRIVAEGLSVRATEEAVSMINAGGKVPDKPKRQPLPQPEYLSQAALPSPPKKVPRLGIFLAFRTQIVHFAQVAPSQAENSSRA